MQQATKKTVPLAAVKLDGGTQMRVSIDEAVVADYAERYRAEPAAMPPIEVMFDGTDYWLVDGFHRWHAMRKAGMMNVPALVRQGTATEAAWASCAANKTHGLRRTHADKRKAVMTALALKPDATDRAISEHVGVGHELVKAVREGSEEAHNASVGGNRKDLGYEPDAPPSRLPKVAPAPEKRIGIDGRSYAAKKPEPKPEPEVPQDQVGRDIPPGLRPAFIEGREWSHRWLHQFSALVREARERVSGPQGADADAARIKAETEALRYIVREQMTPHAVCPLCSGDGCKVCKKRGWHSEESFRVLPPEARAPVPAQDHDRF